jgi:hypothetical protein
VKNKIFTIIGFLILAVPTVSFAAYQVSNQLNVVYPHGRLIIYNPSDLTFPWSWFSYEPSGNDPTLPTSLCTTVDSVSHFAMGQAISRCGLGGNLYNDIPDGQTYFIITNEDLETNTIDPYCVTASLDFEACKADYRTVGYGSLNFSNDTFNVSNQSGYTLSTSFSTSNIITAMLQDISLMLIGALSALLGILAALLVLGYGIRRTKNWIIGGSVSTGNAKLMEFEDFVRKR